MNERPPPNFPLFTFGDCCLRLFLTGMCYAMGAVLWQMLSEIKPEGAAFIVIVLLTVAGTVGYTVWMVVRNTRKR